MQASCLDYELYIHTLVQGEIYIQTNETFPLLWVQRVRINMEDLYGK